VPKISAPTVAEHRARQRAAILAAATELLTTQGAAAVTPAAVGAATGMARSSVYQYFGSAAELVAAVVEDAFPRADAALRAALEQAATPAERVEAYFRENLRLAAEGGHRAAMALAGTDLPPPCRQRIAQLHRERARPLAEALHDLGDPEPELTARLLGGVLDAAVRAMDAGSPPHAVAQRTLALVRAALSLP
jgi:AcrR family transcriptional regulator